MRVVPLLRASELRALRHQIRAYRGPWPIPRGRTLGQVDWPDAPLPETISGEVGLEVTGPPPSTRELAVGTCYEPQPRKGRPAVNVAKQDGGTADASRAATPSPEFEMPAEGVQTADIGGGREGSAAEVASGASTGHLGSPANADQRHVREGRAEPSGRVEAGARAPASSGKGKRNRSLLGRVVEAIEQANPIVRTAAVVAKIDLGGVSSEMDRRAAKAVAERTAQARAEVAALRCEGMVPCRCGAQAPGATTGLVPAWFGQDCIEKDCQLRGAAHG